MKPVWILAVSFIGAIPLTARPGIAAPDPEALVNRYHDVKERLAQDELAQRKLMGSIYEINSRIRKMSDKRRRLTDQMLAVGGNVKDIARQIAILDLALKDQRKILSANLRRMYRMNAQGLLRILFTSDNAHDFDRSLKFLGILAKRDYEILRSYRTNIKTLADRQTKLRAEVERLNRLEKTVLRSEKDLENEQKSKSRLLSSLREQHRDHVERLQKLRSKAKSLGTSGWDPALEGLLAGTFFERKGRLRPPVDGTLAQGYGLSIDPIYRFRLSHKGHFYRAKRGADVRVVAPGRVAFVGELPGYGRTVVISHGDHYYSVYAPAEHVKVKKGHRIESGDVIAKVGAGELYSDTGLYLELRHFSDAIDPKDWIRAESDLAGQQL